MDQSSLIESLEEKIQITKERIAQIKNSESEQSIDIDLVLQHLRECYEKALQLRAQRFSSEASNGNKASSMIERSEAISEEEFDPKEKMDEAPLEATKKGLSSTREESPDNYDEKEQVSANETQDPSSFASSDQEESTQGHENQYHSDAPISAQGQTQKAQPLHEKYRTQANSSLNDRLKNYQQNKALADKWQLSPINDLKAAIKLNERQSFIKELFKGDTEAYREVIRNLNEDFNQYNEALHYLETDVKPHYNWNEESETTAKFVELVYRRFMKKD